jgi:hypothetical protein
MFLVLKGMSFHGGGMEAQGGGGEGDWLTFIHGKAKVRT